MGMEETESFSSQMFPAESVEGKQLLYEKLLANEDFIFEVEQTLRGYYKSVIDGGSRIVWKKERPRPIMNEAGVRYVSSTIRRYLNRSNTVSNYVPERIDAFLKREIQDVATTIYLNAKRYSLDTNYYNDVVNTLHLIAESSMRRATFRREASDLLGANKTATVVQHGGTPGQQSFSTVFPGR